MLLALLPLVGLWRGFGRGLSPGDAIEFGFAQQIRISHDGRAFLAYDSRQWLLADDGTVRGPGPRECGFWLPGAGQDDIELVLAAADGRVRPGGAVHSLSGQAGDAQWELESLSLQHSSAPMGMAPQRRFYAIVQTEAGRDVLAHACEVATDTGVFRPLLNARLNRVQPQH